MAASPTTGPPYDRSTSEPDDPEFLSTTVLSDQLRRQITGSIPLPIADAVLSPLVIVEFLVRSLFQSALALVIPLLIATLVGLWMVWRMRKEVDENELSLSTESLV